MATYYCRALQRYECKHHLTACDECPPIEVKLSPEHSTEHFAICDISKHLECPHHKDPGDCASCVLPVGAVPVLSDAPPDDAMAKEVLRLGLLATALQEILSAVDAQINNMLPSVASLNPTEIAGDYEAVRVDTRLDHYNQALIAEREKLEGLFVQGEAELTELRAEKARLTQALAKMSEVHTTETTKYATLVNNLTAENLRLVERVKVLTTERRPIGYLGKEILEAGSGVVRAVAFYSQAPDDYVNDFIPVFTEEKPHAPK